MDGKMRKRHILTMAESLMRYTNRKVKGEFQRGY
jgi:hypothetical protein